MSADRYRDGRDVPFAEGVTLPPPLTRAEWLATNPVAAAPTRLALPQPIRGAPWLSPASQAEQAVLVRRLVDAWFAHAIETGCCDVRRCPHFGPWVAWLLEWRDRRSGEDLAVELRRLERVGT